MEKRVYAPSSKWRAAQAQAEVALDEQLWLMAVSVVGLMVTLVKLIP